MNEDTQTYGQYLNALRLKLENQRAKIEKAEETHERNHRIFVKYKIETDAEIKDLRAKLERAREALELIAARYTTEPAKIARATLEELK